MSTDPSNNIIQEPPINNTPSMETQDFFQYVMNRTMDIEHETPNSNFISSFLNRLDSNSTNMENIMPPIQSILPPPPLQWTNNILSSFSSDTSSNSTDTDSSNNINYDNVNLYMRFIEDILQLPPLTTSTNNFRTLLRETLGEDKNPIKYVLSVDGEQKIETVEFDPEIYPNINCCPITIKEFKKGDMISKLPCSHLFNTDAILKWLKEEKAECPICRFKLESIEKKLERSDSSNNTIQDGEGIRLGNTRFPHPSTRAMHAFRPPRMPRRNHNTHLRRLMLCRHEQEEQVELQAALLASLEDQYMPGYNAPKEDDNDDTNDVDSNTYFMDSDMDSDMDFDTDDMDEVD